MRQGIQPALRPRQRGSRFSNCKKDSFTAGHFPDRTLPDSRRSSFPNHPWSINRGDPGSAFPRPPRVPYQTSNIRSQTAAGKTAANDSRLLGTVANKPTRGPHSLFGSILAF